MNSKGVGALGKRRARSRSRVADRTIRLTLAMLLVVLSTSATGAASLALARPNDLPVAASARHPEQRRAEHRRRQRHRRRTAQAPAPATWIRGPFAHAGSAFTPLLGARHLVAQGRGRHPVPKHLSVANARTLAMVRTAAASGSPQVFPDGPTSGPQIMVIPFTGPACVPGSGQDWDVEVFVNGQHSWGEEDEWDQYGELYGEFQTGGSLFNYAPQGVSQLTFECVVWDPSSPNQTTVEWSDPGFQIDVTGPNQPFQLNTYTASPGQTLFTPDGADAGSPCPSVAPYSWQSVKIGGDFPGDQGIILGNLGYYDPPGTGASYPLTLPTNLTPGDSYYLGIACQTDQSDGTFFGYGWNDKQVTIADPTQPDQTPVGGALVSTETYGGSDPAEPQCTCAEGAAGDPVNTATGDYWETHTDASAPGNGAALAATRTYNSLAATTAGPMGNGWSFSYGMHLQIDPTSGNVTVVQGGGAQVTFTYSSSTSSFTAPPRVTATLVENTDGTYTFTTQEPGNPLAYAFSATGRLQRVTDRNGFQTAVSYPTANQIVVSDPSGRTLTYGLTGALITSLTDPAGTITHFSHDAAGDLTSVTDPLGRVTTYAYDSSDRLASRTDPDGGVLALAYDSSGRVTSETDPMGRSTTFDYTSTPNATVINDPDGNVEVDHYQYGFLVEETRGYGTSSAATWQYQHDSSTGAETVTVDPDGNTTYNSYDANGNLLNSTDPTGAKTTWTYNAMSEITSETDPLGVTTSYAYDRAGNLLTKTVPLAGSGTASWSYTYGTGTQAGEMQTSTDPDSAKTSFGYDAAGDRTSQTDALGNQTTWAYDADGRTLSTTSPTGAMTTDTYDADGELVKRIDPLGRSTSYAYNGDGQQTSVTDSLDHQTTYSYDADNERTKTTAPDGTTSTLAYDADGLVASQTNGAGNATGYAYDALGRLTGTTDPDGNRTSYTYDADGNEISLVDPSNRTTYYGYDPDNRLTSIQYSDGTTPSSSYTYDADGRRATMIDGTGTSRYQYNPVGQLTSETDGSGQTTGYTYDPAGHLTALDYPNGKTVADTVNADGELASLTDWLGNTTTFTYDGDGNLSTESLPGGVAQRSIFDRADQLSAIADSNTSGPIASFAYTRDGDGQVTADTTTGAISESPAYTYDANGRMTSEAGTVNAYDAADNPTTFAGQPQYFDSAGELQTSGTPTPGTGTGTGTITTPTPTTTTPTTTTPTTTTAGATTTTATRSLTVVGRASSTTVRAGKLSATLTATQAGATVLAVLASAGASSPRLASSQASFVRISSRHVGLGKVSIWSARATKAGRITVRSAPVGRTGPALLSLLELAPGAQLVSQATAAGSGGAPALALRTAGTKATVWAIGIERGSARLIARPGEALGVHAATGRTRTAAFTLQAAAPATGAGVIGLKQAAPNGWVLAAVALHEIAARTDLRRGALATASTQPADTPGYRTFTFNAEGDRTGSTGNVTTTTYGYDMASRLTSVTGGIGYGYDGDGLRTSKTVSGTTTGFTWDDAVNLPLLLQAGGTSYLYGPDGQPLEQITGITPEFLLADQQGSTRIITDASGNVAATYSYDPWGNLTQHTGTATTNLEYDGQYVDPETGLEYLRARYYDPTTGEFLTSDPAVSQTHEPYQYAANAPATFADPTGAISFDVCFGGCVGYNGKDIGFGVGTPSVKIGKTKTPSVDCLGYWGGTLDCSASAGVVGVEGSKNPYTGEGGAQACLGDVATACYGTNGLQVCVGLDSHGGKGDVCVDGSDAAGPSGQWEDDPCLKPYQPPPITSPNYQTYYQDEAIGWSSL